MRLKGRHSAAQQGGFLASHGSTENIHSCSRYHHTHIKTNTHTDAVHYRYTCKHRNNTQNHNAVRHTCRLSCFVGDMLRHMITVESHTNSVTGRLKTLTSPPVLDRKLCHRLFWSDKVFWSFHQTYWITNTCCLHGNNNNIYRYGVNVL